MVPSRLAVSGITLRVVPASIFATVTTAGSKTLTWRVTSVWNACTISHAIGIGSRQSCGADACPPRPSTTTCSVSPDAMAGPGAGQPRDHRRRALAGPNVERQAGEGLEHGRLGARQHQAELGVPVDAPAKLDRVVEDGAGVVEDR